jgi:phosphoribosylformylglycinamidine synthase
MKTTVLVRPKAGILDAQGDAVEGGLRHLGFRVAHVRVGRLIEFEVDVDDSAEAEAEIVKMCEQLLANPLIESYEIHLDEAGTGFAPEDG